MQTLEHPFRQPDLRIDWPALTPAAVVADMRSALAEAQAAISAIEANGSATYAATFAALEAAISMVSEPWNKVSVLDSTCNSPQLREARSAVLAEVSDFFSSIPLNTALYKALKQAAACDESLSAVQQRHVSETLRDFEDAGADLPEPTRQRLKAIDARLADITNRFSENVLDSTNAWEKVLDSADALDGMPASAIEAARLNALRKGHGSAQQPKYRLTLQAPSMLPVIRFAHSEELRKEITVAYSKVGSGDFDNSPIIAEILRLRAEKARLLGRKHFPELVLARRMAGSAEAATSFVADLHQRTLDAFKTENEELMAFKASRTGQPKGPLEPWDFAYWSELLRRERFDFDEEELRPYFPVEAVMHGMFAIVERTFGIRVEALADGEFPVWHPDVRVYRVSDAAQGKVLGYFYADWFPRESKRGGAWMGPILTGTTDAQGKLSPHLGYICGNMTEPLEDRPALLTHREVETVFHEFGHLLHHVLSEVPVQSLSGTNVAWDFVELPSQIMENWCWDREGLDLFARHYQTGASIPDALFAKMTKARNFGAARMQMRQLCFGHMDLSLHLGYDPDGDEDLDSFIERVTADYMPPRRTVLPSNIRSFTHLFGDATGYAAGYYSYKWAEVLDADAFTRFANEGIFNAQTGSQFRQHILAMGNSEDPAELFRRFMGRDPQPDALLQRSGLVPQHPPAA